MIVMTWKWEDEKAKKSESNDIRRPQNHLRVYVLAKNVREEGGAGKEKRTSKERVPARNSFNNI
jgi:hypothetical protein